jgi:predicted O-methyltransferase YrrM
MKVKADISKAIMKYSNMTVLKPDGTSDCLCDKGHHHCYQLIYPDLLEKYLNKDNLNILELGTYYGGSTLIFEELFPTATLYTLDYDFSNLKVDITRKNIIKLNLSQTDKALKSIFKDIKLDIIIDDASHKAPDQIASFHILSEFLNTGGIYIIEDIYPEHIERKEYPESFLSNFEHIDLSNVNGRGDDRLFVYKR